MARKRCPVRPRRRSWPPPSWRRLWESHPRHRSGRRRVGGLACRLGRRVAHGRDARDVLTRFFSAAGATSGEHDERERSNRHHRAGAPNPVSVQLDLRIHDRDATPTPAAASASPLATPMPAHSRHADTNPQVYFVDEGVWTQGAPLRSVGASAIGYKRMKRELERDRGRVTTPDSRLTTHDSRLWSKPWLGIPQISRPRANHHIGRCRDRGDRVPQSRAPAGRAAARRWQPWSVLVASDRPTRGSGFTSTNSICEVMAHPANHRRATRWSTMPRTSTRHSPHSTSRSRVSWATRWERWSPSSGRVNARHGPLPW